MGKIAVTAEAGEKLGMGLSGTPPGPVEVTKVTAGGFAERTGIQVGFLLISVNDVDLSQADETFKEHLKQRPLDLRFQTLPPELEVTAESANQKLGFNMSSMPPERPAYVGKITPGSFAEAKGIHTGFILLALNEKPVDGMDQLTFKAALKVRPLLLLFELPDDLTDGGQEEETRNEAREHAPAGAAASASSDEFVEVVAQEEDAKLGFGLPPLGQGDAVVGHIAVGKITPTGFAEREGICSGFLLTSLNGTDLQALQVEDFKQQLRLRPLRLRFRPHPTPTVAPPDTAQADAPAEQTKSRTPVETTKTEAQTPHDPAPASAKTSEASASTKTEAQTPEDLAPASAKTPDDLAPASAKTPEALAPASTKIPEAPALTKMEAQTPEDLAPASAKTPEAPASTKTEAQTPEDLAPASAKTPEAPASTSASLGPGPGSRAGTAEGVAASEEVPAAARAVLLQLEEQLEEAELQEAQRLARMEEALAFAAMPLQNRLQDVESCEAERLAHIEEALAASSLTNQETAASQENQEMASRRLINELVGAAEKVREELTAHHRDAFHDATLAEEHAEFQATLAEEAAAVSFSQTALLLEEVRGTEVELQELQRRVQHLAQGEALREEAFAEVANLVEQNTVEGQREREACAENAHLKSRLSQLETESTALQTSREAGAAPTGSYDAALRQEEELADMSETKAALEAQLELTASALSKSLAETEHLRSEALESQLTSTSGLLALQRVLAQEEALHGEAQESYEKAHARFFVEADEVSQLRTLLEEQKFLSQRHRHEATAAAAAKSAEVQELSRRSQVSSAPGGVGKSEASQVGALGLAERDQRRIAVEVSALRTSLAESDEARRELRQVLGVAEAQVQQARQDNLGQRQKYLQELMQVEEEASAQRQVQRGTVQGLRESLEESALVGRQQAQECTRLQSQVEAATSELSAQRLSALQEHRQLEGRLEDAQTRTRSGGRAGLAEEEEPSQMHLFRGGAALEQESSLLPRLEASLELEESLAVELRRRLSDVRFDLQRAESLASSAMIHTPRGPGFGPGPGPGPGLELSTAPDSDLWASAFRKEQRLSQQLRVELAEVEAAALETAEAFEARWGQTSAEEREQRLLLRMTEGLAQREAEANLEALRGQVQANLAARVAGEVSERFHVELSLAHQQMQNEGLAVDSLRHAVALLSDRLEAAGAGADPTAAGLAVGEGQGQGQALGLGTGAGAGRRPVNAAGASATTAMATAPSNAAAEAEKLRREAESLQREVSCWRAARSPAPVPPAALPPPLPQPLPQPQPPGGTANWKGQRAELWDCGNDAELESFRQQLPWPTRSSPSAAASAAGAGQHLQRPWPERGRDRLSRALLQRPRPGDLSPPRNATSDRQAVPHLHTQPPPQPPPLSPGDM